ncbi:MAG: hypothetical protein ACQER4_00200 [Bacteroidota bacterium]
MQRSLPRRVWNTAGQLLILLLLVPAIAEPAPGRMSESTHSVESTDRSPETTHDCCPTDDESAPDKESRDSHCTGTYFCTCTLKATPASKGVVPAPDQPLTDHVDTVEDLLPVPSNDLLSNELRSLPGSPPPIWLAHQAILN